MLQTLEELEPKRNNHNRPYEYAPLSTPNSIRVLVLEKGVEGPLEGYLTTCQLNDNFASSSLKYEALSYAWGSSSLDDVMILDGHRARITQSLGNALRCLRNRRPDILYLWADGICINQANIREKNQQVELMSTIFASASRVIAWLGEEDTRYLHPFDLLADIAYNASLEIIKGIESTLESLLSRSWFHRRWIIQEIVLSKDVHVYCGNKSITWTVFVSAIKRLYEARKWTSEIVRINMENIRAMDALQRNGASNLDEKNHMSFVHLLSLFHSSRCSNPRDYIFALLGIAPERRRFFEVDYSNSPGEIFAHFAHHQFLTSGDVCQLLQCAGAFRGSSSTRINPQSWVPEWTKPPRYTPLLQSPSKSATRSIKWSEHVLSIKGDIIDTIARKTRYSRGNLGEKQFRDLLGSWASLVIDKCSYPPHDLLEVLGTTLIAGSALTKQDENLFGYVSGTKSTEKLLNGFRYLVRRAVDEEEVDSTSSNDEGSQSTSTQPNEGIARLRDFLRASDQTSTNIFGGLTRNPSTSTLPVRLPGQISTLRTRIANISKVTYPEMTPDSEAEDKDAAHEYLQLLSRTMSGRCLYRTVEGLVGIGPGDITNGDEVVLFKGIQIPFVLRRYQFESSYRLLGDTWVELEKSTATCASKHWKGNTVLQIK